MDYIFHLKLLVLMTSVVNIVSGDESQYGLRLATKKSLAKSAIDGRIVAILNSEENDRSYSQFNKRSAQTLPKPVGALRAAKSTYQTVNVLPIDLPKKSVESPVIEVSASDIPVDIVFKTQSPKVNVEQRHSSGKASEVKSTRTEEEPQTVRHEVFRPIIQELKEVIQPYRRFIQEVKPVVEEVHQVVATRQQVRPNKSAGNIYTSSSQSAAVRYASDLSYDSRIRNPEPMSAQTIGHRIGSSLRPNKSTLGHFIYPIPIPTNAYSGNTKPPKPTVAADERKAFNIQTLYENPGVNENTLVFGGAMNGLSLTKQEPEAYTTGANDGYSFNYKIPISFELTDALKQIKESVLKSMEKSSKLYEIKLRKPEMSGEEDRTVYSLAEDLTSDDIQLIRASLKAKSK